jgi:diaminohydroxyphosphoribosylaminopyrimidine deaminase/5-amino-6-(5-phosphoribosylamino)uracil reductase
MHRCIELARKGKGLVAPNPMVGCVIVHDAKIIGEGWHMKYGQPHAEVNAINSVEDKKLLKSSTLYVNLEPCAHHGKTPPCADLIIAMNIPYVVIGCVDSFSLVQGKGIEKMMRAGIDVKTGVLEKESRHLNRRFFTFHEQKRPFVILKWAETADGFIDRTRHSDTEPPLRISSPESVQLLHRWRSEEQAILIATNTALLDNPRLTAREQNGMNPLRIAIDRNNRIPATHHLKDGSTPTLILTEKPEENSLNLEYVKLSFDSREHFLSELFRELYRRQILSVLVEGGASLLNSFFFSGKWDEARVFIAPVEIYEGVQSPEKPASAHSVERLGVDELRIYHNVEDEFASQK